MSNNQGEGKSFGKHIFRGIVIGIVLSVAGLAIFGFLTSNSNNSSGGGTPINQTITEYRVLERNATMSDIVLNYSSDLTLGYKFEFTPSKDIKGLAFSVTFYDSDGTCVIKKAKTIGNVVKGGYYTFTFSASEFSLSQMWQITSCTTTIKSGTVSTFS